jgi:hypothetical protein
MFRASYTTAFYRKLRDALHLEVESMNNRVNGDAPQRVALLWREVGELEASCLNTNPTVLCTSC